MDELNLWKYSQSYIKKLHPSISHILILEKKIWKSIKILLYNYPFRNLKISILNFIGVKLFFTQ